MHYVYRHYNNNNDLLYVGVSVSAIHRLISHKKSYWYSLISHIKIEQFKTKEEALKAERVAIFTENPIHNKLIPAIKNNKQKPICCKTRKLYKNSSVLCESNMITFNEKLKRQADKRKARMREQFEKAQPMKISAFARRYYPKLSRSRVSELLK